MATHTPHPTARSRRVAAYIANTLMLKKLAVWIKIITFAVRFAARDEPPAPTY